MIFLGRVQRSVEPSKVAVLAWTVALGAIPAGDNPRQRGKMLVNWCRLYMQKGCGDGELCAVALWVTMDIKFNISCCRRLMGDD